MITNKRWSIILLTTIVILLIGLGGVIAIIDPFFHYHAPLAIMEYPLRNERYQNDGIVKHFQYDAIITGSSMTQNFKTSEFDELFGVTSIKVPFSGGSYKEVNENLQRAVEKNAKIKIVLRGLDYAAIMKEKDSINYDMDSYPAYLYDDIWYNDVNYLFNKEALLNTEYAIRYTKAGNETTTFDAYSNWMGSYVFGKEAVDKSYIRPEKSEKVLEFTVQDYEILRKNLEQNVIALAKENPQIQFYLFFTPYSIYYWDELKQEGMLERQLEAEKVAIELLLEHNNIYLYSFYDDFEMICNLDNYRDIRHYSEDINSQILLWTHQREHLLTKENYQEYCSKIYEFYMSYDYDGLFT